MSNIKKAAKCRAHWWSSVRSTLSGPGYIVKHPLVPPRPTGKPVSSRCARLALRKPCREGAGPEGTCTMLSHQCGGCCAHWCAAHGPNRASVRVAKPASTIASPTCGLVNRRPTRVLGLRRVARNLRCAQAQARRSFGYDPPIVPKRSDGTSFWQPSSSG